MPTYTAPTYAHAFRPITLHINVKLIERSNKTNHYFASIMEFTRPRYVSLLQSASTSSSNPNHVMLAVRKPRRLFALKTIAKTPFPQPVPDSSNTDTVSNLKPTLANKRSPSNVFKNPNNFALSERKPRCLFAWKTTAKTQVPKSWLDSYDAESVPNKTKLNSDPLTGPRQPFLYAEAYRQTR